jgi:predicted site-specific integrase-resolvase
MGQHELVDMKTAMYYTQKEVAGMFRVSQGTVIRWRQQGYLEYFRAPGSNRVLYPVDAVERFQEEYTSREEVVAKRFSRGESKRRVAPERQWRI